MRLTRQITAAGIGLCAVAAAAIAVGCGSGHGGGGGNNGGGSTVGTISTGQSGLAARLLVSGRFTMSDATYTSLKANNSAAVGQLGYTFDDATKSIVFNQKPLRSMFVRAQGQIVGFTDANGLVKLKALPAGTTTLDVVNNVNDKAILQFNASQLGTLDNPPTVVISQTTNIENAVLAMDDTSKAPSTRAGCGGDCGHANTCCLDYDGGVPVATEKQCSLSDKAYHFLGSTCGHWYWEGVCREGMEIGGDEGVCLQRHKGRWCQQINDSDFNATVDKTKINVGETATITLHNNTRKNEIKADLSPDLGRLETANPASGSSGSGQSILVAHYDDNGGGSFTWHPDRTVTYHAPADLPNGQSKADVTVTVYGQTGATTLTIEVCK